MAQSIDSVTATPTQLRVEFSSGPPLEVSWMWVRDHSEDEASFDATTRQRQVDTFTLPLAHAAGEATIDGDTIRIRWADDTPDSVLTGATLREVTGRAEGASEQTLWRSPRDISLTAVAYDDIVDSDAGRAAWLRDIASYGAGLVRNAPTDMSGVDALVDRIGYVRHTLFGGTWTLSSEVTAHADSAYGADTLEPHTDGSYSHDGPGMQMFLCSERTGTGGESVLVDGFAAADELRQTEPEAFSMLRETAVPAHYVEDGVHLQAARPTIRLDSAGRIEQVTFNNYDRSPFVLPPDQMRRWYEAYSALHSLVTDRSTWWTHRLEPGDALIFDNWRCLHGRMAYTGARVFHGAYLNHEDLESAQRLFSGVAAVGG